MYVLYMYILYMYILIYVSIYIFMYYICICCMYIYDIIRLMLKLIDVVIAFLQIWNYLYQLEHIAVCFLFFI